MFVVTVNSLMQMSRCTIALYIYIYIYAAWGCETLWAWTTDKDYWITDLPKKAILPIRPSIANHEEAIVHVDGQYLRFVYHPRNKQSKNAEGGESYQFHGPSIVFFLLVTLCFDVLKFELFSGSSSCWRTIIGLSTAN